MEEGMMRGTVSDDFFILDEKVAYYIGYKGNDTLLVDGLAVNYNFHQNETMSLSLSDKAGNQFSLNSIEFVQFNDIRLDVVSAKPKEVVLIDNPYSFGLTERALHLVSLIDTVDVKTGEVFQATQSDKNAAVLLESGEKVFIWPHR